MKSKCFNCSKSTAGKVIWVDDVYNPHCIECGKPIIAKEKKIRMKTSNKDWEKEQYNKLCEIRDWDDLTGERPTDKDIKYFLNNLFSLQKKDIVEKIKKEKNEIASDPWANGRNIDMTQGCIEAFKWVLSLLEETGGEK
jgi:hypothetical protein